MFVLEVRLVLFLPGKSRMLRKERERSDEQQDGFTLAGNNRRRQRRQANLLQGESDVQAGGGLPSPFSSAIPIPIMGKMTSSNILLSVLQRCLKKKNCKVVSKSCRLGTFP